MNDATLTTPGAQGAAVRLERVLADPPEVVWQALTDRAQLKAWFPCDVIVGGGEWKVGAAVSFPFGPHGGGTRLVLVDELSPGIAARNAVGWETCLDRLARKAPADESWSERFAHYTAEFAPELGPQEGPPSGMA